MFVSESFRVAVVVWTRVTSVWVGVGSGEDCLEHKEASMREETVWIEVESVETRGVELTSGMNLSLKLTPRRRR